MENDSMDGNTTVYKVTGGKTIEQERGAILAKRLELLNDYLLSESEGTFGDFINERGITEKMFISELPKDHQFIGIGNQKISDEDNKEALLDYTQDLNTLYFEQYLGHEEKMEEKTLSCDACDGMNCSGCPNSTDGDNLMDGVIEGSETGSYYASGKRKKKREEKKKERKEKKDEIKKAKQEKKEEKKRIKSDKKSGKISGKEARAQKKAARKALQAKVGSGAGRAIGKVNKFNPYAVAIRAAFISIMDVNLVNIAKAFSIAKEKGDSHWKSIVRKWEVFGGTESGLKNAIEKGKNKKPLFMELIKKIHKADGTFNAEGDDEKNPSKIVATASAGLGSIAGALLLVPEPTPTTKLMAGYVASATGVLATMSPTLNMIAKDGGIDTSNIPEPPEDTTGNIDPGTSDALKDVEELEKSETEEGGGIMDSINEYKWWIIGVIAVIAVGGILMTTLGKKK